MSVKSIIESHLGLYGEENDAWRQFVRDHRNYIIQYSTTHKPSLEYQRPFQNNLEAYLRSINFDTSAMWIVRFINSIKTDLEFRQIESIKIPDQSKLKELYRQFKSIQALAKANS